MRELIFWFTFSVSALIVVWQLLIPPIVGLSDQGDFMRMIGRFGYGPERRDDAGHYVTSKYILDPTFRVPEWEQFSSEYLFVAAAIGLNKLISTDGSMDIRVMGAVHALAFLAALARLLRVTPRLVWIPILLIVTDVGYVAYFNSFLAEPASLIFLLLALGESVAMCRGGVSRGALIRSTAWVVLFILAKPQNAPLGILLSFIPLCLGPTLRPWLKCVSATSLFAASAFAYATVPSELRSANAYNVVFLSILPESKNRAADLQALRLDPGLANYSGTGAWSDNSGYWGLRSAGIMGRAVTLETAVRFYAVRPARVWRHIKAMLPVATSLRPEWCGNFERSAGFPPDARATKFSAWSEFHARYLRTILKFILFALPLPPVIAVVSHIRRRASVILDFAGVLAAACLVSFFVAIFADAWDNVRHLFLFNALLDTLLITAVWWLITTGARHLKRTVSTEPTL